MVQSFKKSGGGVPRQNMKSKSSAKFKKKEVKSKQAKLGSTLKLPKSQNKWLNEALDDRALSKAIAVSSEQKVAAKLYQGGGRIGICELSLLKSFAVHI